MAIADTMTKFFDQHYAGKDSAIFRDLMLNFRKVMEESPLTEEDRFLNLLAIATTLENAPMQDLAIEQLKERGLAEDSIKEARESSALMGMLNTYYKFKGFLSPESLPDYPRAGLRMNSMTKPVNGKEKFEMMSLSVSIVNACPACVSSHEKTLRQLGVEADKLHDLARLAAVCKGLSALYSAV